MVQRRSFESKWVWIHEWAQIARVGATDLVGVVERCPQGRKRTLHLHGYLKEKGTRKSPTSSSWEKTGTGSLERKSENQSDAGAPAPRPGKSCGKMETPAEHRGMAPRTTLEPGPVGPCSGRRVRGGSEGEGASEGCGATRVAGLGPSGPAAGPHSPAHGPEPGPAAGSSAATRSSGITSGFSSLQEVTQTPPPPSGKGGRGGGAGALTLPPPRAPGGTLARGPRVLAWAPPTPPAAGA